VQHKFKSVFITSTGTGVGKTLVTSALCHQLRQQGIFSVAYKPVISGYTAEDENSDTRILLNCMNLHPSDDNIELVSPWRFKEPLAPNMAAEREGRELKMKEVVDFTVSRLSQSRVTLIEGVGGVMVPLNNSETVLDWIDKSGMPVVLVVGNYLGSISHTLSAVQVLQSRNIYVCGIVVSEGRESEVPLDETAQCIAEFTGLVVTTLPRVEQPDNKWKLAANLTHLLKI